MSVGNERGCLVSESSATQSITIAQDPRQQYCSEYESTRIGCPRSPPLHRPARRADFPAT